MKKAKVVKKRGKKTKNNRENEDEGEKNCDAPACARFNKKNEHTISWNQTCPLNTGRK